ncbi:hypothetical protein SAY86_004255 [Trapa natans]|uniref:PRONE domain-containing protein n=1 Tax=Trapa natans TaxID=22666 RepID=A0AAN7RQ44_TRANT|nr:hypothetical protein SAY86_004255 [Trapa natans]
MGSVSSADELEPFERYSTLSADESESESWRGCDRGGEDVSTPSSSPVVRSCFSGESSVRAPIAVTLPTPRCGNVLAVPQIGKLTDTAESSETEGVSEIDMMKELFTKLLLGEDFSGRGKGVCTALAISNAITNLSATVFGEVWKLEPLPQKKKSIWQREMEWLLCVSDLIIELVPLKQESPGGGTLEVMVTRPRADLYTNLPALKKLDRMLMCILDTFHDSEFYYVDHGVSLDRSDDLQMCCSAKSSGRYSSAQQEKRRPLPSPKVPKKGLSGDTRKKLQQYKECANQILKASIAINKNALAEMEVPNAYLDCLPKSGKACLGETIYRYMTENKFYPELLLDYLEVSSDCTTSEIADRIESAAQIWRQKSLRNESRYAKDSKSKWGGKVKGIVGDSGKSKLLAQRAEILLKNLQLRFPGLPQTALDMNKVQYNKDVGHSILESYSRAMESLAFKVMARIDDLLYVDDVTKQSTLSTEDLPKPICSDLLSNRTSSRHHRI